MPKSVNSISCQCGGHYVKKNRSKHMETNKHQSYIQNLDFIDWDDMDFGTERSSYCGICGKREPGYFSKGELQGDIICHACDLVWIYDETHDRYGKRRTDEDEYNRPCSNGCGTILAENVAIFLLSKEGEEDEQWCSECFHDCGLEAREEGWTFDEDGENRLDEMEAEKNKIECLHCGKDTREDVACEHCDKDYNEERCDDKHCEICDHTCIHCNEKSEFDKDTTECLNCGMYQDIECAE